MKKLLLLVLLCLAILPAAKADYVQFITPAPTSIPQLQLLPSADEVRVYARANLSSGIVGYIITGGNQQVAILNAENDWYYVSFSSIYGVSFGWIPASCFGSPAPSAPPAQATPTPLWSQNAFVNNRQHGSRLNLRTQPSAASASLGKYYTGTPVTLTGSTNNGYTRVRIGNVSGWMESSYLTHDPYSFVSELPQVYVDNPSGGLNLRSGANTNFSLVRWFPHGTAVTVLGIRADGWYHVAVGGEIGYMSSDYLSTTFSWQYGPDAGSGNQSAGSSSTYRPAYVSGRNGVHLRQSDAASSASLGVFYTGCPVTILNYTRTGFAYVSVGVQHGYMDLTCLSESRPASCGQIRMIRNSYGTGLNLRSAPDAASQVTRFCTNHTYVIVLADLGDDWCFVIADGEYGYMKGTRLAR